MVKLERSLVALLLVSVAALAAVNAFRKGPIPKINEKAYWGKGDGKGHKDNEKLNRYRVNVDQKVLDKLNDRLDDTIFYEPLEEVKFTYGFNEDYLKIVVNYWRNEYDWRAEEKKINTFNHFRTEIEGLRVHYIHAKPNLPENDGGRGIKVIPLLLVHGWPGSIAEFLDFIPLLTTPRDEVDFVFEVIAPSIPGYGFSDAPRKQGFGQVACAQVFGKLMKRLKFDKYYVQGGDWGSVVVNDMAILYPKIVIGMHVNAVFLCNICDDVKGLASYFVPPLIGNETVAQKNAFLNTYYNGFLEETAYLHIQSSKPDTIATAAGNSPAGLAAYVLEKMAWATNANAVNAFDGLLPLAFNYDQLLTNIMIYWVTGTLASSMRFYKEHFMPTEFAYNLEPIQIGIPAAVAVFPYEPIMAPEDATRARMTDLYSYTKMPEGGHFAALEKPGLLAEDIWTFVGEVEKKNNKS